MLKHLLILTTYGQIFYSQEFGVEDETVDIALTGGLLSAIYSMASETQREKISEFELVTSRIIFKEAKNDLLFVLTIDKRMDTKDADEIITLISNRFFKRYGELRIDGLILTEFEEDVNEVINKKLWYLETPKKKITPFDVLSTFLTTAILVWYMYVVFNIADFIWTPLLDRLNSFWLFSLYLLLLVATITIPGFILYYISKKSMVNDIFKFSKEYLSRPTRASYAELLPNYFMYSVFISLALYVAVMIFAQGYFSELIAYPLYEGALFTATEPTILPLLGPVIIPDTVDQVIIGLVTWITWVFFCPLLYSAMVGENQKRKLFRNSVFIASITISIMFICLMIGGVKYLELVGINPRAIDSTIITFQLLTIIPLNIFFYGFLLFLGIGINRVTPSKTKFPALFAIWLAIYLTMIVQRLFYWIWIAPA